MKDKTVWFNRGLSSTVYVVQQLRRALQAGESLRIVTSHVKEVAVAGESDLFIKEPKELDCNEAAYVDWYLDVAAQHGVDVFIPRNLNYAIARERRRFEQAGVRLVLSGDADTILLVKDKSKLYEALGDDLVPLPRFVVARDRETFLSALSAVRRTHTTACFKPTQGIGGIGFFVVSDDGEMVSRWTGKKMSVTTEEALTLLCQPESFKPQMVMEYLPGQERSVDCLAHEGELVAAIVRVKSMDGKEELLEDNEVLVECCRRLSRKLGLTGLFNAQFMEKEGVQYFLEINTRMAGGVYFGALTGVFLPYWAIKLALGEATPRDVPVPKTGMRVCRESCAVIA